MYYTVTRLIELKGIQQAYKFSKPSWWCEKCKQWENVKDCKRFGKDTTSPDEVVRVEIVDHKIIAVEPL